MSLLRGLGPPKLPLPLGAALLFLTSLFLLCLTPTASLASHIHDQTEDLCSVPLEVTPIPHDWTPSEISAWNQAFCLGQKEHNFDLEDDSKRLNSDLEEDSCEKKGILSSSFINHLLTYRPLIEIFDTYSTTEPIRIKCAIFQEVLGISNVHSPIGILFEDVTFHQGVRAYGTSLDTLGFIRSEIIGDLVVQEANMTRRITLQSSYIMGELNLLGSKADILALNSTRIEGRTKLHFATFNHISANGPSCHFGTSAREGSIEWRQKAIHATRLRVATRLQLSECDAWGDLDFKRAIIDNIVLVETRVRGDVGISGSDIGEVSFKNATLHGKIDISGSDITDSVRVSDATIQGNVDISSSDIRGSALFYNIGVQESLRILGSDIAGMVRVYNATIRGDVDIFTSDIGGSLHLFTNTSMQDEPRKRITISGDINIAGSSVGSSLGAAVIVRSQIDGSISFSRSKFDGDITFRHSSGLSELSAARAIVKGNVSLTDVSSWRRLDFSYSSILGTIETDQLQSLTHWPNVNVRLRNAEMAAFSFGSDTPFRVNGECVPDKSFVDNGFYLDLFGSRYDPRQMEGFLGTDVGCLAEVISSVGGEHAPQPYIYMAERLEDIGKVEKADRLRIHERERALEARTGPDGLWQWIIGRTTGFGYSPEWALAWFAGLICLGMLYVTLAGGVGIDKWIRSGWKRKAGCGIGWLVIFVALWELAAFVILGIHLNETMTRSGATSNAGIGGVSWDFWGFSALALFVWIGVGLSLQAPEFRLRTWDDRKEGCNKQARTSFGQWWSVVRAGLLYSLDRAIPFLGFDGEHVRWFGVGEQRLNDMPLPLCIYFYAHSALGFGFISLFIAGLTGVLK